MNGSSDTLGNEEGDHFDRIPRCRECDNKGRVRPSAHEYKGPYFCIGCCNYLDNQGKVYLA
jgi:hypothetical protein